MLATWNTILGTLLLSSSSWEKSKVAVQQRRSLPALHFHHTMKARIHSEFNTHTRPELCTGPLFSSIRVDFHPRNNTL
jgi:hypothetical protein